MSDQTIRDGLIVSLAYKLSLDGEIIEEATADDPLEYLHGGENIVPGLESALTGKKVGDTLSITLQPEDAYGPYEEDDIEAIPRDEMPDVVEGMELLLEDEEGFVMEASVKQVTDSKVILDFNPPLAGKVVHYDVEVVDIRKAKSEELEHGHPESYDEDMGYVYFEDEED